MSVDKLVDSSLLDASCTYEADKIRAKLGSAAQIAYDLANGKGFGDAIEAIPTGGGDPYENLLKLAKDTLTSVDIDMSDVKVKERLFNSAKALLHGRIRNMGASSGQYIFYNCTNMETAVLSGSGSIPSNTFNACSKLTAVDIDGMTLGSGSAFYNATILSAVIIRNSTVANLGNINVFQGTPFASGKSGGTIYIPKSLYDHLGDGTSLDYKAATNWSTVNGYGTITWAKIEGSQYENYYADGTPIT